MNKDISLNNSIRKHHQEGQIFMVGFKFTSGWKFPCRTKYSLHHRQTNIISWNVIIIQNFFCARYIKYFTSFNLASAACVLPPACVWLDHSVSWLVWAKWKCCGPISWKICDILRLQTRQRPVRSPRVDSYCSFWDRCIPKSFQWTSTSTEQNQDTFVSTVNFGSEILFK